MAWYRIAGNMVHLRFTGKAAKNPPAQCRAPITVNDQVVACCGMSGYLCDWDMDEGQTCDMPICEEHAFEVSKDRHYCPKHVAQLAGSKKS